MLSNTYDVIIIGGGPAGFAAAINSGRLGLKTLIIEKNQYFGGANVASDSGTIGGLYNSTKNKNNKKQIVTGFAKEFTDQLEKNKGLYRWERFFDTWLSPHDPFVYQRIADQMAIEAKIDVLFNTSFSTAEFTKKEVKNITVLSNDQKQNYQAKVFIDASGSGVLAHAGQVPFWLGNNNHVQSLTLIFRLGNVNWNEVDAKIMAQIPQLIVQAQKKGFNLPRTMPFIFHTPQEHTALINATSIEQKYQQQKLTCFDNKAFTQAQMALRKQAQSYYQFFKTYLPGFQNSYISNVAPQVGVRQTRSFQGLYVLSNEDVVKARKFAHGLVRSAWPIELHKGKDGVSIVSLDEDFYEIPYECFVPQQYDNLFFIGKIMSAEHEALASARVVAQCLEIGKAIAYGAYLQIKNNLTNKTIDPKVIRTWMRKTGSNI